MHWTSVIFMTLLYYLMLQSMRLVYTSPFVTLATNKDYWLCKRKRIWCGLLRWFWMPKLAKRRRRWWSNKCDVRQRFWKSWRKCIHCLWPIFWKFCKRNLLVCQSKRTQQISAKEDANQHSYPVKKTDKTLIRFYIIFIALSIPLYHLVYLAFFDCLTVVCVI